LTYGRLMKFATLLTLCFSLIGLIGPARADGPVVVELFTSQGCSACPPADELLAQLATRDDVIALALHVDYWDYIGWVDTFAENAFTLRQHGYAAAANSRVVYTPQMVIGGIDLVVGNQTMQVMDLIMAHKAVVEPLTIDVRRTASGFTVEATADMPPPRPAMVVQIVSVQPSATVSIGRGENAGRAVDYINTVRSWQVVAEWDGSGVFRSQIEPQDDLPLVIIIQQTGHGAIMGAAWLR
jgi:hypothetical protein